MVSVGVAHSKRGSIPKKLETLYIRKGKRKKKTLL